MTGLQDRLMLELVSAKQEKHMRFLKNEILDLIKNGESESVEFKKSTSSLREAIQTICAFANHHGGYVIFGVEDSGRIVGRQVTDDTIKNISNAIKLNTDPKLYPTIEKMDLEGKTCLVVTIDESPLNSGDYRYEYAPC